MITTVMSHLMAYFDQFGKVAFTLPFISLSVNNYKFGSLQDTVIR